MITDLKDLTPELIARFEREVEAVKSDDNIAEIKALEFDLVVYRHLIIECMRVALRWRNEMDQMKEERG